MSFNVASSFASSVPIVGKVPGFNEVLSREGVQALGRIAFDNQAMNLALANQAFGAKADLAKIDAELKGRLQLAKLQERKQNQDMMRMAGMALLGGGGGGTGARAAAVGTNPATSPISTLAGFNAMEDILEQLEARDQRKRAQVAQGATEAAASFGGL